MLSFVCGVIVGVAIVAAALWWLSRNPHNFMPPLW